MRAVVFEQPGECAVSDVPDPSPRPEEVVVRVGACGVCGTDIHIADGEFPPTPYPIIPGHEFAGEVVALGGRTGPDIEVGQRVAVDPSLFCGRCGPCRSGRGNLCENWAAIGDTVDGAFAQYVAVPAANVYRLDDGVDYQRGALVEPLSCAVHAMHRLGPVVGSSILLVGAGTMGLLLQQLLIDAGAASLSVVDRAVQRLEVARTLGASATASCIGDLGGADFDVCVDATGVPRLIEEAFGSVRRGGRLLVFGVAPADSAVSLSPFRIYNDEINVIGSMAVLFSFAAAAEMISAGRVRTDVLLGEPLSLEEFPQALQRVRGGQGIKVQVSPQR